MGTQGTANDCSREHDGGQCDCDEEVLYLISSNWTKKYLGDVVKVMALPRDYVFHFRYEADRWVGEGLLGQLPGPGEDLTTQLEDIKVVVLYLQQQENDGSPQWLNLYPIRRGTLEECFLEGSQDNGIAHFFFRLGSYLPPNSDQTLRKLEDPANENGPYAFLYPEIEEVVPREMDDHSEYINLVDGLNPDHLVDKEGRQYVVPLFRIRDLAAKDDRKEPEWDSSTRRSVYELKETEENSLTLMTYFSRDLSRLGLRPDFSITIETDTQLFSTPDIYEMLVESRYDQETYSLIPRLLEADAYTNIAIQTHIYESHQQDGSVQGEPPGILATLTEGVLWERSGAGGIDREDDPISLDIALNIPVRLKREKLLVGLNIASITFFALGTASLAVAQLLPVHSGKALLASMLSYGAWVVSRVWREARARGSSSPRIGGGPGS